LWAAGHNGTYNYQCTADFENSGYYFFVFGLISLWGISLDILRGLDFFDPFKISLEMAHKVICPQKK